ncbi:hypothetical protein [Dyella sp. C11]|nr:hypothetical protein [Dyella sp. C11]
MHSLPLIYLLTKGWAATYMVIVFAVTVHYRVRSVQSRHAFTLLD